MPTASRKQIANEAADALTAAKGDVQGTRMLIGFDAVVDSVIDVVDARQGTEYTRLSTIDALADRVAAASGRSTNLEFVVKQQKVGGNCAILADCASSLGASVDLVATIADPFDASGVHPVFADLSARCAEALSLGPPGATDALEFDDGKVMLGKTAALDAITWDAVTRATGGVAGLRTRLRACDALVTANWTMTNSMTDIWRRLHTLLAAPQDEACAPGRLFVDMADPTKRTDDDLKDAIDALIALDQDSPVALGLNLAEADRVLRVVAGRESDGIELHDAAALSRLTLALRDALRIDTVLVHTRYCCASADSAATASFISPFVRRPAISTGAGDHFNAGWLLADRLKISPPQCLAIASAVSGWYVRNGQSPTFSDVLAFLRDLPEPEPI